MKCDSRKLIRVYAERLGWKADVYEVERISTRGRDAVYLMKHRDDSLTLRGPGGVSKYVQIDEERCIIMFVKSLE